MAHCSAPHGSSTPHGSAIPDGSVIKPVIANLVGQASAKPAVWFMRQAGRSLPEYREARGSIPMLEACLMPDLAAEITMQPVRRHGVDAAIFFSDIMVPLRLCGVDVDIVPGVGPVLDHPIRHEDDMRTLGSAIFDDPSAITTALRLIREELPPHVALLGFAGAPFTLAAYMVEGRPSKDHFAARALMHRNPQLWEHLMRWCASVSRAFLEVQIAAGVDAVQLFDSWAGSLSRNDYQAHVLPFSRLTLDDLPVPTIHFGTSTSHIMDLMADGGRHALGVDHRLGLDEVARRVPGVALQGNIDPAYLFAGEARLTHHARDVVRRGRAAPGHVVNLGHGVPPHTDPGVLTALVDAIHSFGDVHADTGECEG